MLVSAGGTITPEHLGLGAENVPARFSRTRPETLAVPRSASETGLSPGPPGPGSDPADPDRAVVEDARLGAGGVVSKAAAEMGISRQALYRRMERAGVVLERRPRI
jgi:transcriptional regulator of acetoin/glycerol metabolism